MLNVRRASAEKVLGTRLESARMALESGFEAAP